MKLVPVGSWKNPDAMINATAMVHRRPGVIIRPDAAKNSTRCFLIESVSPEAEEAGYKPGDIVVAKHVWDLVFYGGEYHRVMFSVKEILQRVIDAQLEEFVDLRGQPVEVAEAAQ